MTETVTNKTVDRAELHDIMSSMRRFLDEIPPAKTAKDIVFFRDQADEIYGFLIADGRRAGIYFRTKEDVRRFAAAASKRSDYTRYPELNFRGRQGGFPSGLGVYVADAATWMSVTKACPAGAYGVIDAWMASETWELAWNQHIVEGDQP